LFSCLRAQSVRHDLLWHDHSNPPPSLQALGEILFDDIDEDVISVVGNTYRASDTTYSGLAIGVYGARTI
jgi:hypothetical protein